MIEIRIFLNGKGEAEGLEISGHAGLNSPGHDILCSAVSVLSENLGASLEHLFGKKPVVKKKEGFYSLHLTESEIDQKTEILFLSAVFGLQNLSEQFPERIRILNESSEA
ncbi:MAG: ribosomal-processing cysteine protease Prp [Spirochaetia bacterium]|nr:ribosomal-processing cysteine protease Prp [Spirochaetia bacterium]